jgi:hypothetical protein
MTDLWDAQSFTDDNIFGNSVDIDTIWNSPDFLDFLDVSGMIYFS